MKKTIFTIFSILIGFFGITFANLEITNYKVFGDIQNDGTIKVRENIDVHFFDKMHGIERKFNNSYIVDDIEFATFVGNISIPDYNYKIIDEYYQKNIRIGDADVYVDGDKSYEIDYDIYGLIRNFSGMGYSELYWDVIGYDGGSNINSVEIELTLPKAYTGFTKDDFLISAGYRNKTGIDDFLGKVTRDENKIYIKYNNKLSSYEGITLAVKFPNGYFDFDHEKQESLLVGYTNDFNIENYKISGTIDKSGNITFQNEIELKVLNKDPIVRGTLPYRYEIDGHSYLVKLKDITINLEEIKGDEYDTTATNKTFRISGNFEENNIITSNYSIYGLIRPFSGEFKDWTYNLYSTSEDFDEWAYRLYLKLPVLDLNEKIKNLDVSLDIPGGCSTVYTEDIYVNLGNGFINMNEFNENYGHIRCRDDKLALTYSGEIGKYSSIILSINIVKGTFDLDEELLEAFAVIGNGEFYYSNKTNRQSILLAIGVLLFGGGFKALMNKRYKNKSMMDNKYPIQYDAPRGMGVSEAGVLVDNRIDAKDITALIYQRAANHYIKIFKEKDDEKKFYIKKLKSIPGTSKKYQLNLFNALFKDSDEFHFSKYSSSFRSAVSTATSELTSYIDKQNWYKSRFFSGIGSSFKRQNRVLVFWTAILGFIPYFAIVTSLTNHLVPVSNRIHIILFVSFILIVTSYRNYKEETNTTRGQELREHCQGFKDFLMKVDKVKLEKLLKEDQLYIEKVLPYAVVFGVSSQFIKSITPEQIKDLSRFNGEWYELENAIRYINTYNSSSFYTYSGSSSSHTSYSSSGGFSSGSSFGGGFSSGGGGGGGGVSGW